MTLKFFFVRQDDLPCATPVFPMVTKRTNDGLLIPLDDVLLAMYRAFSIQRPVRVLLNESRSQLKDVLQKQPPKLDPALLTPELRNLGVFVSSIGSYGRTVDMMIDWMPPQDAPFGTSPLKIDVGFLTFKPLPDRTLGKGKWGRGENDILGSIVRDELRKSFPGPPISLLTEAGINAALSTFEWHPLNLMTAKQARAARIDLSRKTDTFGQNHVNLPRRC